MELEAYEIRDHQALISEVAGRVTLHEDTAWLVRVEDPSNAQRVVAVERMAVTDVSSGWDEACDELHDRIVAWGVPHTFPPQVWNSAVLVVVRRGLCVVGQREHNWHMAWRYVNHAQRVFSGDVILVTEHGWVDSLTKIGGRRPALVERDDLVGVISEPNQLPRVRAGDS